MPKATKKTTIHCPLARVHKIICDFDTYPEYFPEVQAIEVLRRTKKHAEVKFTFHYVKTIITILKFDITPETISWSLVKGDFVKVNQGSWVLAEKKDGVTEVIYTTEIVATIWMLDSFIEKHMISIVPEVLKRLKARCEHIEQKPQKKHVASRKR